MKIISKILPILISITLVLWCVLGYIYDPEGTTLGWFTLVLSIELLMVLIYEIFKNK
jgi:hypothetical protein